MLRAAVLGSPIAHSLSPVLHRAAYAALGLTDWEYSAHEVGEDELPGFVAGLDDSWRGLSLTMPLKVRAFAVATDVSEVVVRTGAINTLVRRDDGGWDGDNTDVHGIARALAGVDHDGRATILGSGATSRSALLAMQQLGVRRVRLAARRVLPAHAVSCVSEDGLDIEHVPLAEWAAVDDSLVVSTLAPAGGEVAAAAMAGVHAGVLLDVVYADWPTPLARTAASAGMQVVSGLDMLVHQAAEQVRLMTGHEPPVEAMMRAGRARLGR